MAITKEFFGSDVADAINQACLDFSVSQDDLIINVLETGSAGIFGLCKKKAHIQVSLKEKAGVPEQAPVQPAKTEKRKESRPVAKPEAVKAQEPDVIEKEEPAALRVSKDESKSRSGSRSKDYDADDDPDDESSDSDLVFDPPADEVLESIREDIEKLLELMGFPSRVSVTAESKGVHCTVTGQYVDDVIGQEGRTLDSLQYLIRKMVNRRLPDRMPLYLDAGNYRERRIEELCARARELAAQVKEDGKTQAIPALNPSERRVVHMTLQEDKGIRSRSVGDGLFKKVLIYKPGKGRKSNPKGRRGAQGGRSAGKQE